MNRGTCGRRKAYDEVVRERKAPLPADPECGQGRRKDASLRGLDSARE